jgi:hypothetical protein
MFLILHGLVRRRHVQVATQARSRESVSPSSAQHLLEAGACQLARNWGGSAAHFAYVKYTCATAGIGANNNSTAAIRLIIGLPRKASLPRLLKRRHRGLWRRRIATIMRALRHPRRDRPEPGRLSVGCVRPQDATDVPVAVEHIVIVVRPADARLLTSPLFWLCGVCLCVRV